MAVSASAFGTYVIRSLDNLLQGRPRWASSELRADTRELRRRLVRELSYSVDAENQVLEEDHARQWLAELRQVLYKADQLQEVFDADAILGPSIRVVIRIYTNRYLKQEIKTLLKSIESTSKKRPTMLRSENMKKDRHYKSSKPICHGNLVGTNIKVEIPTLVDKLTEDHYPSQHFILFAIIGLGGIGKTAIARKIFDDQRTRSAFSTRLWVPISKGSTAAQLLLATCASIGDLKLKGSETRKELQKLLADKIGGRRIFLVLNLYDSVPSKESIGSDKIYGNLIEILREFRHASEGSRVLITTSDENVVNEIKSAQIHKAAELYGVQAHRLRRLTVEDGWLLLEACLEQADVTPDLRNIGIQIVQKCNGLPLAIKVVGSVLARMSYKTEEWKGIHDSSAFSLKDPTTGTEGGVKSSIYLSYQDALPHLKQCFIYLSLFPPHIMFEKHMVTQLWISENLIDDIRYCQSLTETTEEQNIFQQEESNRQNNSEGTAQEEDIISIVEDREQNAHSPQEIVEDHSSGETPKRTPSHSSRRSSNEGLNADTCCSIEEIADRFFKELVGRGFLHQPDNNTKGYKMHEQVRKIAESLTENEAFAGDPKDVTKLSATLHRLSFVDKGLTTIPEDIRRLSNLRTLLLSGNPLDEKDLDITFENLKLLRVLDLSDTKISSIPKSLGNLVHLRHLNLSRTKVRALPESMGSLRRLRFLGLQKCEQLSFLPKSIQKLSKLEYLNLQDSSEITTLPRLQNLQRLTFLHGLVVDGISSSGWPLEELQNMSILSSLQIKIRKPIHRMVTISGVLRKKDNLRNIELSCTVDSERLSPEDQERLEKLFTQLHPHECLNSLKIDGYYGKAYPEWLSSSALPNLRQLNLVNCNFCVELPPLFQLLNLKFLRISKLSKLQRIAMQPNSGTPSFPKLEELSIEHMLNLKSWSAFQTIDLPHLRKFTLRRCPKLKHLPGGLEHCKTLATMEVGDVDLQAVDNLVVQDLIVESMPSLTTLSNLPLLKVLTVTGCPLLGTVSGVNSLRHIHIEDEKVDQLPKWLDQHASRIETLDLVGNAELLKRCATEYRCIIHKIARVHTYLPGREPFFSYTRRNDLFFKYQSCKAYEHEDSSPSVADVDQKGASSVPAISEASNDSAREPAGDHGIDWKYVQGNFIWVAAGAIFSFCFTFNLDSWEAIYVSILFSITIMLYLLSFYKMSV